MVRGATHQENLRAADQCSGLVALTRVASTLCTVVGLGDSRTTHTGIGTC